MNEFKNIFLPVNYLKKAFPYSRISLNSIVILYHYLKYFLENITIILVLLANISIIFIRSNEGG